MARKVMSSGGKIRSKSEVYGALASASDLSRRQISALFDELSSLIKADLGKRGPGIFTVPGLMKIKVIHKPATRERQGINPFTKEPMTFKAKPARKVVKVLPLKNLKAMVG
jgi:nucleoid DNA-binding protein